jgi:Trk K+ transport system NAD-binding subunit
MKSVLSTKTDSAPASDDELRLERLRQQRRRFPFFRLILATMFDFGALVRDSWVALLGFSIISAITTAYLLLSGTIDTLTLALFETLRMLVLQSGLDPPQGDPIGVVIFFLTPMLGLALIFQSVLNFGRLLLDKGSRREAWQVSLAATLRNHVVVCGLGRVSYRVVLQLLDAGYEVVAIEKDWESKFVPVMLRLKVPVIKGDARDPDILKQARTASARGFVATINDDLVNIEIALSARRIRSDLQVVMRIFNQELDVNLERSFGRNTAFSSSALAAPTLAAAAVSRSIAHVLPMSDGILGIAEIKIAPDSELCGFVQNIEDNFDIRVLRHRNAKGQEQYSRTMTQFEGGDTALLLGSMDALAHAHERNQPGNKLDFLRAAALQQPEPHLNTVIVCGLGKVGYRVVHEIRRCTKPCPNITVICGEDTPRSFLENVRSMGIRVIIGDAREADALREAGLERAYSVAAVTNDSLVNLQVGLTARRLRDDIHLVLRVFSDVLADRLATLFGIYTAFSSSALAAPTLAAATVLPGIDHAIDIGDQLYTTITLNVRVHDEFAGQSIGQLRKRANVLVIALRRDGTRMRPLKLDTTLNVGDEITVLVNIARLAKLRLQGDQTGEIGTRQLVAQKTGQLKA